MSIDTKGLLIGKVNFEHIKDVIEKKIGNVTRFEINEKNTYDDGSNYSQSAYISFEDREDKRMLCCFFSSCQYDCSNIEEIDHNQQYTQVSLGMWGNSEQIMENIVEEFGGYIDINDCDKEGYKMVKCEKSVQLRPVIHVTKEEINEKFGGIVIIDN